MTTTTTFGTVTRDEHGTEVRADGAELYAWANQPGSTWPLSGLAKLHRIAVRFAPNGDLIDYDRDPESAEPVYADELNAWTSECLIRAGYPNHPALRLHSCKV